MKGLLVKEFRFMLGQKSSFLIFVALGLFFLLTGEDVSFGIMYTMIFASIFAASSITYDSHENGMAFLLTLPIQKKGYVIGKYLFALAVIVSMGAIMCAMALGCNAFGGMAFEGDAIIESLVMAFTAAIVMISLMIPIYIIFGAEKARIAIMVIAGIGFASYFILSRYASDSLAKLSGVLAKLESLSDLQSGLLITGIIVVILAVSIIISMIGLEKKEY